MGGSIVALELRVRVVSLLIVPNHVVLVHSRHVDGIDFFLAFLNQLLSSRIKCRLGLREGRNARRMRRWQYPGHFHCFAAIFAFWRDLLDPFRNAPLCFCDKLLGICVGFFQESQ